MIGFMWMIGFMTESSSGVVEIQFKDLKFKPWFPKGRFPKTPVL